MAWRCDGNGTQIPLANEPGFEVSGEKWYLNGMWYTNETVPLHVDGHISLVAKDGVTYEQVEEMVASYHGSIIDYIEIIDWYSIEVPYTTEEALEDTCKHIEEEDIVITAKVGDLEVPCYD